MKPEDKVSGDTFFHFGGFSQRSWRSNDILWGRLDAAEGRLGHVVERIEKVEDPKKES